MNTIYARNVPHAYSEALIKMRMWGVYEETRNGPVYASPDPVLLEITHPHQRVLFDTERDANPFFHVMEFVWMMTGSNDVKFPERFNKKFRSYADPGTDIIHGAYGYRWRKHFKVDQIKRVIDMLKENPSTRRAVLGMWDPSVDLDSHPDLPCNVLIMFRQDVETKQLDMTVVNRSNDLIWGMLGANAVHMTMLHELICGFAGLQMGTYRVFTNNLHIYHNMPNFEKIWATYECRDEYRGSLLEGEKWMTYPIANPQWGDTYESWMADAVRVVDGDIPGQLECNWFKAVAWPMKMAYYQRLEGLTGYDYVPMINALDWRLACTNYIQRREAKKEQSK